MHVTAKRRCTSLLPTVVSSETNKDLATPRTADVTMRSRLAKRCQRGRKVIVLQNTEPMRALMEETVPDNATPYHRFIWKQVRQPVLKPPDLSHVLCGLCWATRPHICSCGATMAETHDPTALNEFGCFVLGCKNPMLRTWDPEDQRELMAAMNLACKHARWTRGSKRNFLRGLAALCSLAGLTGRATTVERAGVACVEMNWKDLQAEIQDMVNAGMPIYRGGQRPGAIPLLEIPTAIKAIDKAVGSLLVPGLLKLVGRSRNDLGECEKADVNVRRHALLQIIGTMKNLVDNKAVRGISQYKCKRILEMILLACYTGLAGLYAEPSDLRVVHSVYPLPRSSVRALTAIFPSARSERQKRSCLRLLQKTLKPGVLDVSMIVAQLCFWREEQDGKLQYTHEEGVVSS